MKKNKNKGESAGKFSVYSNLDAETIRKAALGDKELINCVVKKYKGYVAYIIRIMAKDESVCLDEIALEDIEQQVWKGLSEDIKRFKILSFLV